MYPHALECFGVSLDIWNVTFLVAVLAGYPVLIRAIHLRRPGPLPRWLPTRWLIIVYLSALAAQLFAYLFDLHTSLLPPSDVSWARYYLDPLFGSKTLYGVIVFLPLSILAVSLPWRDLGYTEALDCWTPPLFAVLGLCRIGCFLQGCCYGRVSPTFGISFPPYGALYYRQLDQHLISPDSPTLPVLPTQLIEAGVLFALCAWSLALLRRGRTGIFPLGVLAYSLLRFVIELLRDDPDRNFLGPLSSSQWIAVTLLASYPLWKRRAFN